MGAVLRILRDHPIYVSGSFGVLVMAHAYLSLHGLIPNIWVGVLAKEASVSVTLFLGTAAAAAILAGFAGVVVVFGLTAEGERFRAFRVTSGVRLRSNWTSTSLAGFTAAGLSLASSICTVNGPVWLAPWLFELSLLLMFHGALRTVWILRSLVTVVRNQDLEWAREKMTRKITADSFK
ncbi:hypothetical protein [Pseudarthrobacter siccitolerans]